MRSYYHDAFDLSIFSSIFQPNDCNSASTFKLFGREKSQVDSTEQLFLLIINLTCNKKLHVYSNYRFCEILFFRAIKWSRLGLKNRHGQGNPKQTYIFFWPYRKNVEKSSIWDQTLVEWSLGGLL